jgi:hypothetical protein
MDSVLVEEGAAMDLVRPQEEAAAEVVVHLLALAVQLETVINSQELVVHQQDSRRKGLEALAAHPLVMAEAEVIRLLAYQKMVVRELEVLE